MKEWNVCSEAVLTASISMSAQVESITERHNYLTRGRTTEELYVCIKHA